jgi:hypothetical protein
VNDLEWPPREPLDSGDLKDCVTLDRSTGSKHQANHVEPEEHDQRTQIVWLPSEDSALDVFASEADLPGVPAPSPAAVTAKPGIASAADSTLDQAIEAIRPPAIEIIGEAWNDPVQDYQIDSARNVAIEPIRQYARRGTMRRGRTTLLRRCAIFVVLALGVFGGGLAGSYLRRNPIDLAIIRIPVDDTANQATLAVPVPETAPPPASGDVGTTSVNAQPVTPAGGPPVPLGNQPPPVGPPPEAIARPNATAASTRTETPVPGAAPRTATENLSPPLVVAPPAPTAPPPTDPLTTAGVPLSTREINDGREVASPSPAVPIAPAATVEASVVAPAAAGPAAPVAGTSSTTDRVRVTDATPGIAAAADEQRIAAVLKRFTDAYTQLNAPAAKAVWPSVDGRALSRAFDALESQSIEFDDCTVHFAGAEARAACVGNITYVPKIGRRSARTVNRHWNFVMKRNSEGWMIADAQMR